MISRIENIDYVNIIILIYNYYINYFNFVFDKIKYKEFQIQ